MICSGTFTRGSYCTFKVNAMAASIANVKQQQQQQQQQQQKKKQKKKKKEQ